METQKLTGMERNNNSMLERLSQQNYVQLTEAFERIRRHGRDGELLGLLTTMHEAEELELSEERSNNGIRFWKAKETTRFEERRRLLNQITDRVQWAMGELFLRGDVAFTTDNEVPPYRIVMTGLGENSYKPELESTRQPPAGLKCARGNCKSGTRRRNSR
jgi:hypothetical protein